MSHSLTATFWATRMGKGAPLPHGRPRWMPGANLSGCDDRTCADRNNSYDRRMDDEEIDIATLQPNFRAWLIGAADLNFDRFEAAKGDQATTVAIIAELMTATIVYGAWQDHDSGAFRFIVIKGRDVLSEKGHVLCAVLPCKDRETAMQIARDCAA
jgi:hypothetical protein